MIKVPECYTENEHLRGAFLDGYKWAADFARFNVPRIGDEISCQDHQREYGNKVTRRNVRDYHITLCHAAEELARCFSPFEYIAYRLNAFGDGSDDGLPSSDEAWRAFDDGVSAAIRDTVSAYTMEDYGIA